MTAFSDSKVPVIPDHFPCLVYFRRNDPDWIFDYVSQSCCELTGYTVAELQQNQKASFVELIDPGDRAWVLERWKALPRDGQAVDLEYRISTKAKTTKWVWDRYKGIFSTDGVLLGAQGMVIDISERKEREASLAESERRYRALTHTNPVGIWQTTPEGSTIYMNPAMLGLFEIDSPNEMEGKTYLDFYAPESIETVHQEHAKRLQGVSSSYEVEVVGRRGTHRNVVIYGVPLYGADGKVESFIGTLTDITERKKTESALRASEELNRRLLENVPGGIVQVANDGAIINANEVAQKLLGLTLDQHTHHYVADFGNKTIREDGTEFPVEEFPVTHCLKTGEPQPGAIIGVRRPNGAVFWGIFSATPIFDPRIGKTSGAVVIFLDITNRKEIESKIRESEERFSKSFRINPVGMAITQLDSGVFVDANDAFLRTFGFEREEVLGRNSIELGMWFDPSLRDRLVHELREKGTLKNLENGFRRKTGEVGTGLHSLVRVVVGGEECVLTLFEDITDKQRAERELRESEDRFQQLAANINEVFWMTDLAKNQMLYISPGYEKIWGRTCESLYQSPRTWLDAIHADDRERILTAALTQQTAGKYAVEYRIVRPDGTCRWIFDRAFPIRNAEGEVYRVVGVARDITDRKLSEEKLRNSEARYRLLFESNPHPMWVFDSETLQFLAVNDAAVAHYEYSREEFLGMTLRDIRPSEDVPLLMQRVTQKKGEMGWAGGWRHRKKDGTLIDVEIAYHNIEFEGRAAKLVLVSDVTERLRADAALKESQRFLEKAQEVAHIGSWVSQPELTGTLTWSDEVYRIFGVDKQAFDGRVANFLHFVHPEDRASVTEAIEASINGTQAYEVDHRIVRPDGTVRWVHEQADVVRDSTGKATQLIGIVQDITGQKQLEDRLRQSQKLEAIGQLAGGVAHDFNNILTVIQGHASVLLGKQALPEGILDSLKEILLAAERAANLTRQLLAFGRRQVIQRTNLDMNEVVDHMSKMLRRILGEDITLEVQSSSSLPLIHADAGMIEQVILNLAVNSRDAMPKGGRLTIQTSALNVDEEYVRRIPEASVGPAVCLRVSDTGCGISPANLPHIFEPFFTTKELGKGTGLGLATVYGIIKQHQGWVEIQSAEGQGTTFRVYLSGVIAAAGEKEKKTDEIKIQGGTERILIVEDEKPLRELVKVILERYGYKTWTAHSGHEALLIWERQGGEIDLLFTDLVMPEGMTGRELAMRLRSERPNLKVIFTTGYSRDAVGESSILEGGSLFLQKPYRPSILAKTIRDCLDAR